MARPSAQRTAVGRDERRLVPAGAVGFTGNCGRAIGGTVVNRQRNVAFREYSAAMSLTWRPSGSLVRPFAVASAVVALVGCASPAIEVKAMSVEQQTNEAVRLGVDIDLTNPADAPMRLLRWDYSFASGGETYRGTWEALTTLPPKTTISRRVPVVLPASADVANRDWSVSGSLSYRSPSRLAEIFYDFGVWRPSSGFGGSGSTAWADPQTR
jgi:hypothetical protein